MTETVPPRAEPQEGPAGPHQFPATRWSRVRRYAEGESPAGAERALDELCRDYWLPLYAYARRRGSSLEDAQDMVQGFFHHAIKSRLFGLADPAAGRLRSFLLVCFRNFCSTWIRTNTTGPNCATLRVDWEQAEGLIAETGHAQTNPEKAYDRHWAMQLLSRSLTDLERDYEASGRAGLFAALRPFLTLDEPAELTAAEAAQQMGLSLPALRQTVHRLRKRYGAALRQHVADTLEYPSESDVDCEMEALQHALSGGD